MRDVNHASNSIRSRSSYACRLKKILICLENMIVTLSLDKSTILRKVKFFFSLKKIYLLSNFFYRNYLIFFFYSMIFLLQNIIRYNIRQIEYSCHVLILER